MVHGHYPKIINTELLPGLKCPHCGNAFSMQAEAIVQVNHIMYVPLYPSKKRAAITCNICGTSYAPAAFPGYAQHAAHLLATTKNKWYHYTAAVLLLFFIGGTALLITMGNIENRKQLKKDMESLATGTVIFYNTKDDKQTCMKIILSKGDTVVAYENMFATNQNPYKLDEDYNYDTVPTIFTKQELSEWLDANKIINIYK